MAADERLIFHCDCNNFFASCECLEFPELKDVPMAVAGDPEYRTGIVVAKNELAKRAGVKTTDTVWQVQKKCPGTNSHPPCMDRIFSVRRDVLRHEPGNIFFQILKDIFSYLWNF